MDPREIRAEAERSALQIVLRTLMDRLRSEPTFAPIVDEIDTASRKWADEALSQREDCFEFRFWRGCEDEVFDVIFRTPRNWGEEPE